ncbi:hypothetical protein [Roseateles depolymerans]|uniref:Uncharacterized protein n=1 Tax=Roseateles depolymerans TaxID=76731 RepID=A0A0U2U700_9BURK|nr:hypothetical protein [Roseateles depolymerans]ALV07809.1 hypothetical protein RD2015_3351 [Roseateles depolymerans]REG21970.1 hypothetical protein DES44_1109 [Roseateles depolymerans]
MKTREQLLKGSEPAAAEFDSDTIFTAAFIGMVSEQLAAGKNYRVDMEPSREHKDTKEKRSDSDVASMHDLNDICAKVNAMVLAKHKGQDNKARLQWGLTEVFKAGGMISAGAAPQNAYAGYSDKLKQGAWEYLTQDRLPNNNSTVYIGRGAYCGLVTDQNGDAIAAMSTLRTTLGPDLPYPIEPGERWLPGVETKPFQDKTLGKDKDYVWGMIANSSSQQTMYEQGMKFVPDDPKRPASLKKELVGYTHGMIRAIYEARLIGDGLPYEMSLGKDTAKLASCMSCSLFMLANDYPASSSHLGSGESWLPLYHTDQHVFSYRSSPDEKKDKPVKELLKVIQECNEKWQRKMHQWLNAGAVLMRDCKSGDWIESKHLKSLDLLLLRLQELGQDAVGCANLYLDAMTIHKKDTKRLNDTLCFGAAHSKGGDGHATEDWLDPAFKNHPWMPKSQEKKAWVNFKSPFEDKEIKEFYELALSLENKRKTTA